MKDRPWLWLLWLCVALLAGFLRMSDLGERPIHADEATGARIASNLIEDETYTFNPGHFHGPALSYSTWPIAVARGETNWQSLTEETLRMSPVIAGILLVLSPLLWLRRIGHIPALMAAALLATSPLLVFYSRMYIHETWLALFGVATLMAGYRLLERPSLQTGAITGVCLGFMFATKETFAISVISWAAASLWYLIHTSTSPKNPSLTVAARSYLKPTLALTLCFFGVSTLLYTNFFKHPAGLVDAFRTFFVYETTPGHEKSFAYYIQLLLWPKNTLGHTWTEAAIALLALSAFLFRKPKSETHQLTVFLSISILGHLLIYSLIAYKTPWLMLLPWAQVCLLAGLCLKDFKKFQFKLKVIVSIALLGLLGFQTQQSTVASQRFASDERNPYSYVPTTKDPARFANWLAQITESPEAPQIESVAVVGQNYWPLPWYLRNFDRIGYWTTTTELTEPPAIVFAMPEATAACDELLAESHQKFPRSLRSNVSVSLYLSNELWNSWKEATQP
jgi:uncharacterized protein (TIGR03663 family)